MMTSSRQIKLAQIKPAKLSHTHSWLTRLCASLVIATFFTSCVSDPMHKAALKKVKDGPVEEGVAKLKESSAKAPEVQAYRVDYLRERERAVNQTLFDASRALGKGNLDEAESLYGTVLSMDADNAQARLGMNEVDRGRRHAEAMNAAQDAMAHNDFETAHNALQAVLIENPKDKEAQDLSRQIDTARYTSASFNQIPEMSAAYKKPISLQFKDANLKMIFEAISRTTGLNILIDKDVKADLKATVFVKQASVEDTISLILLQNQLEKKILNETTLYIYPATTAKIKENQDLVIRTFQLTNADAKQMQVLLKTMIKAKDVFINEKTNSLVVRDTPEAVALAAKLIAAQDLNEPEVMLEMEVLEVSENLATQIGIDYPDKVSFTVGDTIKTLQDWRGINRSKIDVTQGLGVTLNLKKTDGEVNTLANPRIRVRQREKAKILIGSRFPIITNTVTPSTGTPVVTGSIQYIDIGLKLEVEPDIHMDGEVGIKTALEVSSLGANVTSGTGDNATSAPVINTRTVNTVLRLKDGETQVLAGLINNQEIDSNRKVPGLGDIPIFGRLFTDKTRNKDKTELILAITPHIIRNIHQPDAEISSYWSGTDNNVRSRPITVEKIESISMDNKAPGLLPNAGNNPQPSRILRPAPEAADIDSVINDTSSAPTQVIVPRSNGPTGNTTSVSPASSSAATPKTEPIAPATRQQTVSPTTTTTTTTTTNGPYVIPRGVVNQNGVGMSDSIITPGLPQQ
jgi:general secretion pathway protein D